MTADSHHRADVFFNQACPVCGRPLHVRVQLLGERVYCQHCGGGFTAFDESLGGGAVCRDRVDDLLARAERLLHGAECGECGEHADQGFSG